MKKLKNIAINVTLFAIIIVGLLLVFNKPLQAYFIARASDTVLTEIHATAELFEQNKQQQHEPFNFDEVESLSLVDILALQTMKSTVDTLEAFRLQQTHKAAS